LIHHKDWDHDNNDVANLVDLCQRCHGLLHSVGVESYDVLREAVVARRLQGDRPRTAQSDLRGRTNYRGRLKCSLEENCAPAILFQVQMHEARGGASVTAIALASVLRSKLECAAEASVFFDVPRRRCDEHGRFESHLFALVKKGHLAAAFESDRTRVVARIDDSVPPVGVAEERGWWRYSNSRLTSIGRAR
jgi:hypothetical protein